MLGQSILKIMFIGCSNNIIMVDLFSCNVKRKHSYNNTLGMLFLCYLYTIEVLVMLKGNVLITIFSEHYFDVICTRLRFL